MVEGSVCGGRDRCLLVVRLLAAVAVAALSAGAAAVAMVQDESLLRAFREEPPSAVDLQFVGEDPFGGERAFLVLEFFPKDGSEPIEAALTGEALEERGWLGEYRVAWRTLAACGVTAGARSRLSTPQRVSDLAELGRLAIRVRHRGGPGESPLYVGATLNGRRSLPWFSGPAAGESERNGEWETAYEDANAGAERIALWPPEMAAARWEDPAPLLRSLLDEPLERVAIDAEAVRVAVPEGSTLTVMLSFAGGASPIACRLTAGVLQDGGISWADLMAQAVREEDRRRLARCQRVKDLQRIQGVRVELEVGDRSAPFPSGILVTANDRWEFPWFWATPKREGAEGVLIVYEDPDAGASRVRSWAWLSPAVGAHEAALREVLRSLEVTLSPPGAEPEQLRFDVRRPGGRGIRVLVPRSALRGGGGTYSLPWEDFTAGAREEKDRTELSAVLRFRDLLRFGRVEVELVHSGEDPSMPDVVRVGLNGHEEFHWFLGHGEDLVPGPSVWSRGYSDPWGTGRRRLIEWAGSMENAPRRGPAAEAVELGGWWLMLLLLAGALAIIGERILSRLPRLHGAMASSSLAALCAFVASWLARGMRLRGIEAEMASLAVFLHLGVFIATAGAVLRWGGTTGRRPWIRRAAAGAAVGSLLGYGVASAPGFVLGSTILGGVSGAAAAAAGTLLIRSRSGLQALGRAIRRSSARILLVALGAALVAGVATVSPAADLVPRSIALVGGIGLLAIALGLDGGVRPMALRCIGAGLGAAGIWLGILFDPGDGARLALAADPVDGAGLVAVARLTDPSRTGRPAALPLLAPKPGRRGASRHFLREIPNNYVDENGIGGDLRIGVGDPRAAGRPVSLPATGVVWVSVESMPSSLVVDAGLAEVAPRLAAWLKGSVVFSRQYVASPGVEVAHMAMLGGGFDGEAWTSGVGHCFPLAALRDRGWFLFAAGPLRLPESFYARHVHDWRFFGPPLGSDDGIEAYWPWLEHYTRLIGETGRPFFHFVHLSDLAFADCESEDAPCRRAGRHDARRCGLPALDDHFARILEAFESQGLLDRAVVLLSSATAGEGDLALSDAALRGAAAIRRRGASEGRVFAEPISSLDLLPTVFEEVGAAPLRVMRGRSLASVLRGAPCPPGTAVGMACHPSLLDAGVSGRLQVLKVYGIRGGRLAVVHPFLGLLESYDLAEDPEARTNRWGSSRERDREVEFLMDRALFDAGLPDTFPFPPDGRGRGSGHPPLDRLP